MAHHPTLRRLGATIGAFAAVALVATGCSSAGDDDPSAASTPPGVAEEDTLIEPSGDPSPGGKVVYGLEAETDGFTSTENRWAISGTMVALAVYDPLTALDADAEPQPYLAESVTPNDDATVWTIQLRPGVTFHDGTAVDAAAVTRTLEGHMSSILTGSAVDPIESVTPEGDLTVRVQMKAPWAAFDSALTSQVGFVLAPSQFDDPDGNRNPVGSGPFVFRSWQPDASLVATKNESYWREGLPYLDEVEFRPIPDNRTRIDALATGQLDMLHSADPGTVLELRNRAANGEVQLVEDRGEGEEGFVMLNMSKPPLDDVTVRRAIAHATDRETYIDVVDEGVPEPALGPFKSSSPWYVETDYPRFDLEEARRLVDEWEAENGPISFSVGTTESPETREAIQVLQGMWQEAGMDVEITTVDQANFIGEALAGNYEANLWRQFGAPDPDNDLVWWIWKRSDGTDNFLNFARLHDEQIDDALTRGRQSTDLEVRREAYADFQHRLAELVPYVWLSHSVWTVAADNDVRGIHNGPLPDGSESIPLGGTGTFGGTHRLTQVWLER